MTKTLKLYKSLHGCTVIKLNLENGFNFSIGRMPDHSKN